MIFIYTTYKELESAKAISRKIIEKRLAAGVNIWPIYALMGVRGECKEGEGYGLLIRTVDTKIQEIEDMIAGNHPGGIPMIASFDTHRINRAYKDWMAQTIE